jgi:hypothetical protein
LVLVHAMIALIIGLSRPLLVDSWISAAGSLPALNEIREAAPIG